MAIDRNFRYFLKNSESCTLKTLRKYITPKEAEVIDKIIKDVKDRNPIRKYDYQGKGANNEES